MKLFQSFFNPKKNPLYYMYKMSHENCRDFFFMSSSFLFSFLFCLFFFLKTRRKKSSACLSLGQKQRVATDKSYHNAAAPLQCQAVEASTVRCRAGVASPFNESSTGYFQSGNIFQPLIGRETETRQFQVVKWTLISIKM